MVDAVTTLVLVRLQGHATATRGVTCVRKMAENSLLEEEEGLRGSPVPGPMAFTIDFGGEDRKKAIEKKLALRDSIKRFAPAKKTRAEVVTTKQDEQEQEGEKEDEEVNNTNDTFLHEKLKAKEKSSLPEVIIDEENNIAPAKNGGSGSDAGTYTIDNEEEDKNEKNARKTIGSVFGVRDDQLSSRDWVSMWASNSFMEKRDEDNEEELESHSLSSLRDSEGRGSQRRKLPATPSADIMTKSTSYTTTAAAVPAANCDDTNEYLRDTISLMTAMEARISSEEKDTTAKVKKSKAQRPKTASAKFAAAQNSNNHNSGEKAKELAAQQWQRRKNYDPLKSVGKQTNRKPLFLARSLQAQSNTDESLSDPCSDVESATTSSSMPVHGRYRPTTHLQGGKAVMARPSQLARNDGGRHSLRNHKTGGPPVSGSAVAKRTPGIRNAMQSNNVRSTSSLSSKEAEFQAWKRRKNYNPMRAAAAGASSNSNSSPKRQAPIKSAAVTKLSTAAEDGDNIHRSASFHYPDGLSRVQHNVYTSEDESQEDSEEQPRLYEVNDDELFLAFDNGPMSSMTRVATRKSPGRGSSSSSNSNKLEALDNLVISTIFSVSTKLCLTSGKLIRGLQERAEDDEQAAMLQTLLYVLEDVDPPVSPSKKTSRELAGTLRNLKKVEQALQTLERSANSPGDM